MKTKEEIIREAWIAEIGEEKYSEYKVNISDNGWFNCGFCCNGWQDAKETCIEIGVDAENVQYINTDDYGEGWGGIRPKSLSGIENNNGWNRIDEGLPSESDTYIVLFNNHDPSLTREYWFDEEEKHFYNGEGNKVIPTHYRKKEVYPDPIY